MAVVLCGFPNLVIRKLFCFFLSHGVADSKVRYMATFALKCLIMYLNIAAADKMERWWPS